MNGCEMLSELKGRVAVVTGASQGIGRMIALVLAEKGAQVVLLDVSEGISDVVRDIQNLGSK
jgi:NAD(P)-dependent dehydrogenase (short-subunit alcohol dehydrogenase family)